MLESQHNAVTRELRRHVCLVEPSPSVRAVGSVLGVGRVEELLKVSGGQLLQGLDALRPQGEVLPD